MYESIMTQEYSGEKTNAISLVGSTECMQNISVKVKKLKKMILQPCRPDEPSPSSIIPFDKERKERKERKIPVQKKNKKDNIGKFK